MRLLSAYLGLDDTWQSFARDAHLPLVELNAVDVDFIRAHEHLTAKQVTIVLELCNAHESLRIVEEILDD